MADNDITVATAGTGIILNKDPDAVVDSSTEGADSNIDSRVDADSSSVAETVKGPEEVDSSVDSRPDKAADDAVKKDAKESLVREGRAEVFSPSHVFYNPVQQFNRDLTIVVITQFAKDRRRRLASRRQRPGTVEESTSNSTATDAAGR